MNRKRTACILLVFAAFFVPGIVLAQESSTVYRIQAVVYEIDGKTREGPLADRLDIEIGKEFPDSAALNAYVADRLKVLINQRVLESGSIDVSLGEAEGNVRPVTLIVRAEDTWNMIALPYPKYTTNDGLLLSLRFRNYNFLGSMETLYVDLDYRYDENRESSYGTRVEFKLPFELADLNWAVGTAQTFSVAVSGLISYTGTNTLELYLPGGGLEWTLHFNQDLSWNAGGATDYDLNKLVLGTSAGLSMTVDLFEVGGLGTVTWTPDVTAGILYLAEGQISSERRGPSITGSYVVAAGRADWIGNFRNGTVIDLKNACTYNLLSRDWTITATARARMYRAWGNRVGLNSRLVGFASFTGVDDNIGGYIRGVPDARIDGDYAVFANLDLPIRLFDFKPSLLIKKDWLDFEAHASPFMDAALVRNGPGSSFEPYLAGGLELFGFLKRARSIYGRLSVGIDALGYLETRAFTNNYELFFGLGHDY